MYLHLADVFHVQKEPYQDSRLLLRRPVDASLTHQASDGNIDLGDGLALRSVKNGGVMDALERQIRAAGSRYRGANSVVHQYRHVYRCGGF